MIPWEIRCGEYHQLDDVGEATWFIDPPYQATGRYYMVNTVEDYAALRDWTLARSGQLIVCERSGANWLPFHLLGNPVDICGKKKVQEVVFLRGREKAQQVRQCPKCNKVMTTAGEVSWCRCGYRVRYLPLNEETWSFSTPKQ